MKVNKYLKRSLRITLLVLKIIGLTVVCLLILYSAAFSICGTIAIYKTYKLVSAPVKDVLEYQDKNPVKTHFMEECIKELKRDTLSPDTLVQTFIPLDSISTNLVEAVIAAEDDAFYLHPGVDVASILAAAEYNKTLGKNRHGASTITQQLAKNLFLSSNRSFDRKIREVIYAVLMEKYLGKDRILELYLNYAQWGRNIFGCEAAAQFYYKKSARKLTLNESARMAAVLAKPSSLTPLQTKSVFMSKRIAMIAQNLYLHHIIGDSDYFGMTGTMPPPKPGKDSTTTAKVRNDSARILNRTSF